MKYPLLLLGFLGVAHGLALYAAPSYPFVYSAGGSAVFTPTQQQFISQDALGQYSYAYAEPLSSKQETRTLDGTTRGTYSYRDAAGKLQTVDYLADAKGFHVAATNLPKAVIPRELVGQGRSVSHGVVHPVEHHAGHIVEHHTSQQGVVHSVEHPSGGHVEHHPVDISGRSAVHRVHGHPEAVHHTEEHGAHHSGGHVVEHHSGHVEHHPVDISGRSAVHGVHGHPEAVHHTEEHVAHPSGHVVEHHSGHVVEHPVVPGTGRSAVHSAGHELPQPVGDTPEVAAAKALHLKQLHDEQVRHQILTPHIPVSVPVSVARSHHVEVPAAVYGYTRPHYYASGFYY